jgi:hypothetical protein
MKKRRRRILKKRSKEALSFKKTGILSSDLMKTPGYLLTLYLPLKRRLIVSTRLLVCNH